jgi:hypothetical protein
MDRPFTSRSCIIGWLLCAVLVCFAIHAPHCDLCDRPYVAGSPSPQTLVNHLVPGTPDMAGLDRLAKNNAKPYERLADPEPWAEEAGSAPKWIESPSIGRFQ